jgi:hypothetical protein
MTRIAEMNGRYDYNESNLDTPKYESEEESGHARKVAVPSGSTAISMAQEYIPSRMLNQPGLPLCFSWILQLGDAQGAARLNPKNVDLFQQVNRVIRSKL